MEALASVTPGVFNVGTGVETDVLVLLGHLQDAAGSSVEPRFEPLRPGELRRSALDVAAIGASLGWQAKVGLVEGLAETYRSYASV